MESSEEQQWIGLVIRSLRGLENLDDEQLTISIEVAQNIRSQLRQAGAPAASTIALMMMQLDDLDKVTEDFDPAFA